MRQALEQLTWKLNRERLEKGEILVVRERDHAVILRGHTNLQNFGWVVYSGPLGHWQARLNHDRFLRGTPKPAGLVNASKILSSTPEPPALYRLYSTAIGYQSELLATGGTLPV